MYDVDDRRTNGIPGNAYEDVYHGQRPDAPIQAFDPPRKPLQQEDHSKDNRVSIKKASHYTTFVV